MKPKLIIGGSVLLVLTLIFLFVTKTKEHTETPEELPIVTVNAGTVFIIKDEIEHVAITGERVPSPFAMRSDSTGDATVRLGDGSELRIDPDSALLVNEATYSSETKKIAVSVKLSIGKVWSNIVALATPESSWEVETSNVVATVRGTAFGVRADATGETTVIGSEHSVGLTLINPDTGLRDEGRTLLLNDDEFITITNELAREKENMSFATKKKTDAERDDSWVQKNEKIDKNKRGESYDKGEETRVDDTVQEHTENPEESREVTDQVPNTEPIPDITPPAPEPVKTPAVVPTSAKPISIVVTPQTALSGIAEETKTNLTATLTFSDGTKRDVTREATWKVIGKIGNVQSGTFNALLDPSVSELGKASGSIGATWKDPVTGTELFGATPIFEVRAKVYQLIEEG